MAFTLVKFKKKFANLPLFRLSKRQKWAAVFVVIFLIGTVFWISFLAPPTNFPSGNSKSTDGIKLFSISEGETLGTIAAELKNQNYIRSPLAFKVIVYFVLAGERDAVADDYFFEKPLNVYSLAKRIVRGTTSISPIRVTIPEGLNKFEIAELLAAKLPNFSAPNFIATAPEGYLFPDTYFFSPKTSADLVIETMTENFTNQIAKLRTEFKIESDDDFGPDGQPLADVVKLASIVETEARQTATRKTIAGILWKRLGLKMPLQVDVSFKYINGKNSYNLTDEDLKIDSPYNTYLYAGLPPTPIANPGLNSLRAAIAPTKTSYLFFLSDRSGTMYYAKTFDEHKENRIKYLHVF